MRARPGGCMYACFVIFSHEINMHAPERGGACSACWKVFVDAFWYQRHLPSMHLHAWGCMLISWLKSGEHAYMHPPARARAKQRHTRHEGGLTYPRTLWYHRTMKTPDRTHFRTLRLPIDLDNGLRLAAARHRCSVHDEIVQALYAHIRGDASPPEGAFFDPFEEEPDGKADMAGALPLGTPTQVVDEGGACRP